MEDRRTQHWYRGIRNTLPYVLRYSALWLVVMVGAVLVASTAIYLVMLDSLSKTQLHRFLIVLVVQTAGIIVAAAFLAMATTHRLAEPLLALRRALEEVRDGHLDRTLAFRSNDAHLREIEVAFNEMMATLRKRCRAASTPAGDGSDPQGPPVP